MKNPVDGMDNTKVVESQKNNKFVIGLFVLMVIAVIIGATYIANMTTPKKIFETSLNNLFDSISKTDNFKTITGDMSLNVKIDSEDNDDIYEIINNLNANITYGIDYENKKVNLGLDSFYKNKDLLTVNAYLKNDNVYIYLEQLFDKYVEIPIDNYVDIFNNKDFINNYKNILIEVVKALKESLKDSYFTSEKTSLVIDDKKINVTKNKLNLNHDNLESLIKDAVAKLNNENFIKNVASLTDLSEAEIKDAFEQIINEDMEDTDDLVISIYTKGSMKKFVAFEIEKSNDKFMLTSLKDNTYKYELINDEDKIDGTINISKKNDANSLNFTLNINPVKELKVTFNFDISYKYNEKVEDVDTTNYIYYDNLTDEDQNMILNNLISKDAIMELIEEFKNMSFDFSM